MKERYLLDLDLEVRRGNAALVRLGAVDGRLDFDAEVEDLTGDEVGLRL